MSKALIYAELDYAPKTNGKKFAAWCEKYGFYPLNSGRRAWCSAMQTYFRDALGVAVTESGETFLFYEEDVATDVGKYTKLHANTKPKRKLAQAQPGSGEGE